MTENWRRKKTDWPELFKWLEAGYRQGDIAMLLGIQPEALANRAKRQLSPEDYKRWRELCTKNREAPCGTYGAYLRHNRRGEPQDDACREAWAAYCKRGTQARKFREMTPKKIHELYQRKLTREDRSLLRRLLRNEMERLGYRFGQRDQHQDDGFMTDQQRQVYRIFMSVAAEREQFYARHPEFRNRSDDAGSPEK